MLTSHRKLEILAMLKRQGQVEAKDLATAFGVSEDTIRRDLRELAAEGSLQRVHGGALPVSPAVGDYGARQSISSSSKTEIARAAIKLIQPGQVIILDGGTTCAEVARQLPHELVLTVVTHSPTVAVELVAHPHIEVILIGGRLFKHSLVTVGAGVLAALAPIRADTYFMGVTGVHDDAGYSTGDFEEACVKRALASHAAETVVLASSEKLGAASRYKIGDLSMASTLIVERSASPGFIDRLAVDGLTVLHA